MVLGIIIGIFVGWCIPQPEIAKRMIDSVKLKLKNYFNKTGDTNN